MIFLRIALDWALRQLPIDIPPEVRKQIVDMIMALIDSLRALPREAVLAGNKTFACCGKYPLIEFVIHWGLKRIGVDDVLAERICNMACDLLDNLLSDPTTNEQIFADFKPVG